VNAAGPLGYLIPELQAAGCRVEVITGTGYADAAARLRTLIVEGRIAHMDDPRLNRAIEGVETRPTGDRSIWKKKDSTVDETPLVAVSLAVRQAIVPGSKPGITVAGKLT
jgi:phage terminase large subunit-like protein